MMVARYTLGNSGPELELYITLYTQDAATIKSLIKQRRRRQAVLRRRWSRPYQLHDKVETGVIYSGD